VIKVRFLTTNLKDVCVMIENHLNCGDISDWIEERIENLSFDGMDYPYDLEECYECYYQCQDDNAAAREVYALLKESLIELKEVSFDIYFVDEKLNVTATAYSWTGKNNDTHS